MKKLVVLMAVLASAACGSSDDKNKNTNSNSCTGSGSKCDGTVWKTCNNNAWITTKDCASTSQLCRISPALPTQAECYTETVPAQEFEKCTGTGQGNCVAGLVCKDESANPPTGLGLAGVKLCVTDCSASASVCGARTCDPIFKFCLDASGALGDSCGLSGVGCGSSLTCEEATRYADGWACNKDCGFANINAGVSGCPAVTTTSGSVPTECLKGEFVDVELNADESDYIYCESTTTAGQPDQALCNQNSNTGFVCNEVSVTGGTALLCTKAMGRCGVPMPSTPSFKQADLMDSANACGFAPLLCKPQGTADAQCEYSGYVGLDVQMNGETEVSCTDDTACDTTKGYKCKQLSSGKYCTAACSTASDCDFAGGWSCDSLGTIGKVCNYPLSYCVDFCDNGEACGSGRSCNTPKVDCNENATCEATGNSQFFPMPEVKYDTSGNAVDCSTDITLCDGDTPPFTCMDFAAIGEGKICARAHKVCTTP